MNNIRTYQLETTTWLQKLDELQQENILLKNTVANIIKNDVANNMLDAMEQFLNKFIDKDAALELLRHDIARAIKQANIAMATTKNISTQHKKLSREILLMEEEFNRLKTQFNHFIARHQLY